MKLHCSKYFHTYAEESLPRRPEGFEQKAVALSLLTLAAMVGGGKRGGFKHEVHHGRIARAVQSEEA